MALGSQFEDTYHYDDNNNLHIHLNINGMYDHRVYTPEQQQQHKQDTGMDILTHTAKMHGKVLQGTIFTPHAFTGTKDDPAYTAEERTAAIQKGLKLTSPQAYSDFTKSIIRNNFSISSRTPRDAISDIHTLTQAAFNTEIPTTMFSQMNTQVVMNLRNPRVGGTAYYPFAGNYQGANAHDAFIAMSGQKRTKTIEKKVAVNNPYIINPTYGKDYIKARNTAKGLIETQYRIDHHDIPNSPDERGLGRNAPEFYLTKESKELFDPENKHENAREPYVDNMSDLPGYLWPGKGKDTDEYTAHPIKVRVGLTFSRSKSYKTPKEVTFHLRARRPNPDEESRIRYKHEDDGLGFIGGTDGTNTLAHEIGHIQDHPRLGVEGGSFDVHNNIAENGADTVSEAIGDGFADRFGKRYSNRFESDLLPSADREEVLGTTGYSTQHSIAGGRDWENLDEATGKYVPRKKTPEKRLKKALYAAVRLHVSLGDNNHKDILGVEIVDKFRRNTGESLDRTQSVAKYKKLVLGHLYTNHKHVRDMLSQMGLDDVGKEAADHYRSTITDAGRPHPDDEPQLKTLFD